MKKSVQKNIKPFVSVVIPVFNGSSYLEETISSIQQSTYKRFEILLVDDGSRDTSKMICKKLEKKYKKVRFYSFDTNKGLGRVLNFALEKAKGEYICRINQDDRMYRYRIEKQVRYLLEHKDVVVVGSWIKQFKNNKDKGSILKFLETDEQIKKIWLMLSPFSDPAVMYRKKSTLKVGGYDQKFWPADDVHLWYRLGRIGKLANIQKPLVEVRQHDKAASIRFFRKDTIKTFKLHLWAHENVEKAPWYVFLFWICQLIAGYLLPAEVNWTVYRYIKKIIDIGYAFKFRFLTNKNHKTKALTTVTKNPIRLRLSGT